MDYKDFNCWAKNHITNENMFDADGNIVMENKVNHKTTGIIAEIFEDHWDKLYKMKKDKIDAIRRNAPTEIQKVIDCANHNLGSSIYTCPNCDDEVYFCYHTRKGKLCSSCGIKTQNERTENILEKCITSKHRHMTFTMPKILTSWFIKNLLSLNIIFESVCKTIYSVCNGKFKKKIRIYKLKYKPGFFAFLHTFGRPLNFNPHIMLYLLKIFYIIIHLKNVPI